MPNGKTPSKGEVFKNKLLANDYRLIANSYGKDFYQGTIAKNIVESRFPGARVVLAEVF